MKSKLKNKKGITLIALIITIIIMLILVAVSINVLIQSNIIGAAKKAGQDYKTESKKEATIGKDVKVGDKSLEYYIEGIGKNPLAGQRVEEDTEYKDGNKTAMIPEYFTVSGVYSEATIDGGLVIYDIPEDTDHPIDWSLESDVEYARTHYNQYVWIPVEYTKTGDDSNKNGYDDGFDAVWTRSIWENNERVTEQTSTSFPTLAQYYPVWSDFTEPYSYNGTKVSESYDGEGTGKTGIAKELEDMTESVYKYGGFYIARYEAGTNEARTGASKSAESKLQFVQDAYPYNYVVWGDPSTVPSSPVATQMTSVSQYGAVGLSRGLTFDSESTSVTSMLCSGVAWDAMLDFVKDSDHSVTNSTNGGNYLNAEFDVRATAKGLNYEKGEYSLFYPVGEFSSLDKNHKSSDKCVLLTTGASEHNNVKNIYDIAGNCYEWTTEAVNSDSRAVRGGSLRCPGSTYPTSHRTYYPAYVSNYDITFRPTLYVNL